jgi:hypothetical protein
MVAAGPAKKPRRIVSFLKRKPGTVARAFRCVAGYPHRKPLTRADAMVRMDDAERPDFDLDTEVTLEAIHNQADMFLRSHLEQLLYPTAEALRMRLILHPPTPFSGASMPKQPAKLRLHIADYAQTIYISESHYYPDSPKLASWLVKLAERILERALGVVAEVEEGGARRGMSLEYHGVSDAQMQKNAIARLTKLIENRLSPPAPLSFSPPPPLPPEVQAQMDATRSEGEQPERSPNPASKMKPATPENLSVVERRAKLLAEYQAETGVTDYAIYMGNSGIYKPQFRAWKAGKLPESSSTAQNFERFLREKKAPTPRKRRK